MDEMMGLKYMLMDEMKELAKGGKLNAVDVDALDVLVACEIEILDR